MLRVAENSNPGWRATLDGRPLETMALDGWQQGYRVPAGDGGRVVLDFTPDRPYRAGLWIGAALALLLVVGTLVARAGASATVVVPDVVAARLGPDARTAPPCGSCSSWAAPSSVAFPWSRAPSPEVCCAPVPRPRWLVAGGCVAAGGLITAVALATGQGHLSGPADLVAGVGVGLLVAALPVPADTATPDDEESP